MPVRAVVFDLFDTLVDLLSENIPVTEYKGRKIPGAFLSLRDRMADYGSVDLDDFLSAMGDLEKEFLTTHYSKQIELSSSERFAALSARLNLHGPGLVDAMVETHMRGLSQYVRFLDHHRQVLEELRQSVRIGICSNFSHSPTAERVLLDAGLSELLDSVVISERVGIRKPRAEIFVASLESLQVEPTETLHVGDNLNADVAGAAALGIRTVWLTRRISDPATALASYSGPPPDFQIVDLSELPEIVREADSQQ